MEKRALLAVVLSLMVLFVWNAIFPPPKPKPLSSSNAVLPQAQTAQQTVSSTRTQVIPDAEPPKDKISVIETPEAKFIFSDIGGSLTKIEFFHHKDKFPEIKLAVLPEFAQSRFSLVSASAREITYSFDGPEAKIVKKYEAFDGGIIKASIFVQSKTSRMDKLAITPLSFNTAHVDKSILEGNDRSLLEYAAFTSAGEHRKGDAHHFSPKENRQGAGTVKMVSYRDRYYCVIVQPDFNAEGYEFVFPSDREGRVDLKVAPEGKEQEFKFTIYAGQQNLELLKSYKSDFEKVVTYSGFGLFDSLAKFFYWIFTLLNKVIPNLGICIIIVGFLIYFAVYPLTMRGMDSMRKMQQLQPEMAVLREKHKSNPQKLNKEVMDLYKKYNINPFSGCFTFILQMPVFIGIYQVLWRAPMFKDRDFLWIKDLSQPDRLFTLPYALPVIGNEINILPVVMAVIMFFQQKITMQSTPVMDATQATQQKIMLIFFPIFLGFIFYKFSSGLVVYFTIFYALSAFTQFKMSKLKKVN